MAGLKEIEVFKKLDEITGKMHGNCDQAPCQ